jgi:hypothetical protein
MHQETVIYLTNVIIGVILASLVAHYWRERRQSGVLTDWAVAAWVLVAADILCPARPLLPHPWGRLLPTLWVTVGQAILLAGAQQSVGVKPRWRLLVGVVAAHAAGLVGFLFVESPSNFRMVLNGLVWGSLSVASALCLRQGPRYYWQSVFAPATAFWAHAGFHAVRVVLALVFGVNGWDAASASLQAIGNLEVSFFMVALFVGLLIAHLQLRHEELMRAQVEVETLSGLLPICAWCMKVRDDDGYWRQVEEYFSRHSRLKFTHGICLDCMEKINEDPEPVGRR